MPDENIIVQPSFRTTLSIVAKYNTKNLMPTRAVAPNAVTSIQPASQQPTMIERTEKHSIIIPELISITPPKHGSDVVPNNKKNGQRQLPRCVLNFTTPFGSVFGI